MQGKARQGIAWHGNHFEAAGKHGGKASKKFPIRTLNVSLSSHSKASHAQNVMK